MSLLRSVLAAAALAVSLTPAAAGDLANLNILGFSADGHTFAFEEYGEFDGSADVYSNRYYIDTATDSFVPGSPVRIRLEDDIGVLAKARAQSREAGEKFVPSAELEANPGYLAGFHTVGDYSVDPYRISVNPRPVFAPVDPPMEFRLEEFPVVASKDCENMGDIAGFRLLRIDGTEGGVTKVLHDDKSIPASRNCPNGYRIGAVQTQITNQGEQVYAVLISVRSMGFEGPDFRWIAVTGKF